MPPNKRFRVCLITFILIISSLSFLAITPVNVKAEENTGGTQTFYFTAYNMTNETGEIQTPVVSLTPSEGKNYSQFPPSIENTEEWLVWFNNWLLLKAMGIEELANETGMTVEELEASGILGSLNPFKMKEIYTYIGADELHVTGNVAFDLYFSSNLPSRLLYKDQVKVTISVNAVEINNSTATIEPKLFQEKIQKQTITIDNVDFTLAKGDEIEFSIEMLPSDKPIGNLIASGDLDRILENANLMADILINQSLIPSLKDVGEAIKELINTTQSGDMGFNLTLADLAELVNAIRSSSFVYDSAEFDSSVTLPIKLAEEENAKTYYLSGNGELNEGKPTGDNVLKGDLIKQPQKWTVPGVSRNKILKSASASIYIQYRDLLRLLNLGKLKINVDLMYDGKAIASSPVELKKTTIFSILKPVESTVFTFVFEPQEIEHDKSLTLEISAVNGTRSGPLNLGIYRMAKVLYNSSSYPSYLTLKFEETDNIKMTLDTATDQKIVTGGSAEYILNITSKYDDNISLNVLTTKLGEWNIDYPPSIEVSKGYTLVHIFANHTYTGNPLKAYGDFLEMTIVATGKTGIAQQDASATVSMDAAQYDIAVTTPSGQEIKHGTSGTYTFTIKNNNTGYLPDTYDIKATSENNWSIEIDYDKTEVAAGDEFDVYVTVLVPKYTEISSDKLTLTIKSKESDKEVLVEVTTTVILPNVLENIYHFFETSAESLGLTSILGDYAAPFLIFLIIFIIIIFLIIAISLIRRKYVEIICLDRIKQIDPEEKAEFDIQILNPSKTKLTYEINVEMDPESVGWEASLDIDKMVLEPKESHPVKLTVKPNDFVKTDGWVEVKVVALNVEKQKTAKISIVTSIKHAEPEIRISGVFHWPQLFKKGDKVITSFRVNNDGKASASNVTITLFVNGEEKNKVENITIPRGGYAEIEMPWIAVKGKNEVNIVVK